MTSESVEPAKRGEAEETADSASSENKLVDGLDYYLENGLLVFTAHFLLKRGYCCESACRHCPYKT